MQIHLVKETTNLYSSMDKMIIKSTKTAYCMHYQQNEFHHGITAAK